jgi:hypothetical protein
MEGQVIAYACPVPLPTPTCVWWDVASKRWSPEGCAVESMSETAVTCACSHLTDFALRFAVLEQLQEDLFVSDAPLTEPLLLGLSPL